MRKEKRIKLKKMMRELAIKNIITERELYRDWKRCVKYCYFLGSDWAVCKIITILRNRGFGRIKATLVRRVLLRLGDGERITRKNLSFKARSVGMMEPLDIQRKFGLLGAQYGYAVLKHYGVKIDV